MDVAEIIATLGPGWTIRETIEDGKRVILATDEDGHVYRSVDGGDLWQWANAA